MADETERNDETSDGLEGVGADMLRLLLREERKAHEAELARLKAEATDREHALRRRRGEVPPPTGSITQGDLARLSLDERVKLWPKVHAGEVKIVPGPATPKRPQYSITAAEVQRLPLDERVRVQQQILRGEVLLIR